ncbi:MAG TPA: iron chelate uptake ABC transporter family permease subunit [Streptosporangiaceae bacterium]|jgi:iron complex transport system permease protein
MSAPTDVRVPQAVLRAGRHVSVRVDRRAALACAGIVVAALAVSVVALGTGDYPITPDRVLKALVGHGEQADTFIVMTLRLPRVLSALLIGAAFGMAGAVYQSLSRNPLGSPDVIGFTQGSATGALIQILVLGGSALEIAVSSLVGCLLTVALVYVLAYRNGVQGYRLVLIGIGLSAMLVAVNRYLILKADINDAERAQVWETGSLNGSGWENVVPVAIALVVLMPLALSYGSRMRMLEMGDDTARGLGVNVERSRIVLLAAATVLTAVAVAAAGPVQFIALAAPQVARRVTGAPSVGLASASCMGALLLVLSDLAAQRLFAPTQLPVGVMTVTVGGVYLAWLLFRERRKGRG